MAYQVSLGIICQMVVGVLLAVPAAAQFDDFTRSLDDAISYRVKNFSHCNFKITVEDFGSRRKRTKISIDIWVRDESVRNDISGDRESRIVIHQGNYIVQWAGDTKNITIAPLSAYADPRGQFGVVHPRDIGMVNESLSPQANGETRWLLMGLQDDLSQSLDRADVQKDSESEVTRYSVNTRYRVPKQLPAEVTSGAVKLKDYLNKNPDAPLLEFECERNISFSPLFADQPTSYELRDRSISDGSTRRTQLVNEYQKEATKGLWYPKTSVWKHFYNDELLIGRRVEVLKVDFTPIADSVFSLSGMDLKDDVRVTDRRQP